MKIRTALDWVSEKAQSALGTAKDVARKASAWVVGLGTAGAVSMAQAQTAYDGIETSITTEIGIVKPIILSIIGVGIAFWVGVRYIKRGASKA